MSAQICPDVKNQWRFGFNKRRRQCPLLHITQKQPQALTLGPSCGDARRRQRAHSNEVNPFPMIWSF
ncbi:hypothetical protein M707_23680 [Arthrobacter sp. AK-YN10]|nr:hypothetical protein M707_23680 [Arthrobacter sp. AK-YN10]